MKVLISKYNYFIVAISLGVYGVVIISKGHWSGDFWEHCAVVKEFSKNLLNPSNPMIGGDIPHVFFSPYSIIVSLFSAITSLSPIESLEFFAFFNLILFLLTFYLFCKFLFKENYNLIATISLIFTLFFWGHDPYRWSGFYHFTTLHYVLPYPSTFAMALVFLIMFLILKDKEQKNYYSLTAIIVLTSVVTITHPATTITLHIAIVAAYFVFNNYSIKKCIIKSSAIVFPSLILCAFWPYYSIFDLFGGSHIEFHKDSIILCTDVAKRVWPILLIAPYLFFYKKDQIVHFLLINITALAVIYVLSYLLGIYGFARVISNVMMFTHFFMAYIISTLLKNKNFKNKIYLLGISSAFCLSIFFNKGLNYYTFSQVFQKKNIHYYQKFTFLKNMVESDDIVLSQGLTNWMIPAFNGKILSSGHALYWVDDIMERRQHLETFFLNSTPNTIRQNILNKYDVDYVLLNLEDMDIKKSTYEWLKTIGITIYKQDKLELIKLSKND